MYQKKLWINMQKQEKSIKSKLFLKQSKVTSRTKNTSINVSAKKPQSDPSIKLAAKKTIKQKSSSLSTKKRKQSNELKQKIDVSKKGGSPKRQKQLQKYELKQQKMEDYLKMKVKQSKYVPISTRQFKPIISSKDQIKNEVFHTPHQSIIQQPLVYSQFQEEQVIIINKKDFKPQCFRQNAQSILLPESHNISRKQWQAIQSLKMKNQELSNYAAQLQKQQKKLIKMSKLNQENIKTICQNEKNQLKKEIGQLRQHQTKLSELNASLVQMFNEGKQNIDLLTNKCNELNQNLQKNQRKELELVQEKTNVIKKVQSLQGRLRTQKQNLDKLLQQRQEYQSSIRNCNIQKQKIKQNAQEVLKMLHQLQQDQEM